MVVTCSLAPDMCACFLSLARLVSGLSVFGWPPPFLHGVPMIIILDTPVLFCKLVVSGCLVLSSFEGIIAAY